MNILNQIWDFFASVRLAIFTLIALAVTSIAGTIIPQNEPLQFYIQNFGPKTAQFFHILDLHQMYYSWWFLGLLGLLSANLVVCSIERFPSVWKIIHANNYSTNKNKLMKMPNAVVWKQKQTASFSPETITSHLKKQGWNMQTRNTVDGQLFFAQKYRWSRIGVYLVHTSILIIFAGAIVGHFTGFKGSIMLPEQQSSPVAYSYKTSKPLQLGFDIRCDFFSIEFYPNGMPKEYQSKLTVIENGNEVLTKTIEVNDPLTYKGITFYQASYQGYQNFIIGFQEAGSDNMHSFSVPFQKQSNWEEENIRFGIVNAEAIGQRVARIKTWIKAGEQPAVTEWLGEGEKMTVSAGTKTYEVTAKQMYATGLQVAKDPGVWIVYLGCGLMILGLYLAFFLSHKRLWLLFTDAGTTEPATAILAGVANKNKPVFTREFEKLKNIIEASQR